jgi:hypothetical protein
LGESHRRHRDGTGETRKAATAAMTQRNRNVGIIGIAFIRLQLPDRFVVASCGWSCFWPTENTTIANVAGFTVAVPAGD